MRAFWILPFALIISSNAFAKKIPSAHLQFFEKKIRPLLSQQCYRCHGEKRQRADLRLDSRQAIMKGGQSGPALAPGNPEKSLLIRAIQHRNKDLQMPPSKKLNPRQINDLVTWVKLGAPFPEPTAKLKPGRHWAFEPVRKPPLPTVKDREWAKNPIDLFILADLEKNGQSPRPLVSDLALFRRLHYDLLGLPPTPEAVKRFKSLNPSATLDRLLASSAYGERWGRHWLDVARYADSNGLDENIAHGNAWRYRDYVIESFNRDKPFDRFVLEQLAGDLLTEDTPKNERLIATGFLSLGPKVLAEVDETKMEMDIIDEQIDTLGRAFMGLTMGCARCHDHKFDPIETEDYYALAGIFRSTHTMDSFKKIAKWYENPLESKTYQSQKRIYDQKITALQAKIKNTKDKSELKKLHTLLTRLKKEAPEPVSAMGVKEGKVVDARLHRRGSHLTLGSVIPRRVPLFIQGENPPQFSKSSSGRLELAKWLASPSHPLTARVIVNRVWRWHFGTGLVRTPDNFGRLGEKPTHPKLLDWLASYFVEHDWSIKKLHRLILSSNTYRQDTGPRRLEAEAIRDAMLLISGRLDPTRGGSLLHVKNREFLFNHTSKDLTKYDSRRRTIYLPVIRNHLFDMLSLFDCTDATVLSGHRATTTVAPQALFLMNSQFVTQVAESLANDLMAREVSESERVRELYLRAYSREPSSSETARALSFVSEMGVKGWAALCQVVLASNEFVYVR